MSSPFDVQGVRLDTTGLIALRNLALRNRAAPVLAALPGGHAIRDKGQGLEVADVREYVTGDDIRHLDRTSTARTGRLHVRQFQSERDRISFLVADFRSTMFWGLQRAFLSVATAEALMLEAWPVVESGGRVGLLALTDDSVFAVPARGRVRGMLDVIGGMVKAHAHGLANAGQDPGEGAFSLDQSLVRLERLAPNGSEIVLASGFDRTGPDFGERLSALSRRRSVRLLLVNEAQRLPTGRYPVRLPDGRRLRLALSQIENSPSESEIAGRAATIIDAGAPIEETARHLAMAATGARAA